MSIPQASSLFLATFTSTVPIYGKRGHIVLAALLQVVSAISLLSLDLQTMQAGNFDAFIALTMGSFFAKSWMDPVIKGMEVIQMRLDPERGAVDLKTYGRLCTSVGSIAFSFIGGIIFNSSVRGKQNFYYFSLAVGLILLAAAFTYPKESERHEILGHANFNQANSGQSLRTYSLSEKLQIIKKILGVWRMQKIFLYIFIATSTQVNFSVYISYCNSKQIGLNSAYSGPTQTVGLFTSFVWLVLYASVFLNKRNFWFVFLAVIIRAGSDAWIAASVNVNLAPSTAKLYFELNALLLTPYFSTFLIMPATVAFTKCVPQGVETIMMGMIASLISFNKLILMRFLSWLIMHNTDISMHNYDELSPRIYHSLVFNLGCIFLVKFVVDRHEFQDIQAAL
jgi:hypothetical protein